jgi:hypothetical protein
MWRDVARIEAQKMLVWRETDVSPLRLRVSASKSPDLLKRSVTKVNL